MSRQDTNLLHELGKKDSSLPHVQKDTIMAGNGDNSEICGLFCCLRARIIAYIKIRNYKKQFSRGNCALS